MLQETTVWFAHRAAEVYGDIGAWWGPKEQLHLYPHLNLQGTTAAAWSEFCERLGEEILFSEDLDSETILITGVATKDRGRQLRGSHAERLCWLVGELRATPFSWRLGIQLEEGLPTQELKRKLRALVGKNVKFREPASEGSRSTDPIQLETLLGPLLEGSSIPSAASSVDRRELLEELCRVSRVNLAHLAQREERHHVDPRVAPERWAALQKHLWDYAVGPMWNDHRQVAQDLLLAGVVMSTPEKETL